MKNISENIKIKDFEEFKKVVLAKIRTDNYLDLIDDWEKHIIFKDFRDQETCYFADLYFVKENYASKIDNGYSIKIYEFYYSIDTNYFVKEESIVYRDAIKAITKFENTFNENSNCFISHSLDLMNDNNRK